MIDNIFIIHHPSLKERKVYLEEAIRNNNLQNIVWESDIYDPEFFNNIQSTMPKKSIEVSFRHQKILKDIVNKNIKFALILEDDVILKLIEDFNINEFLNICVSQMKQQDAHLCFNGIGPGLPDYPPKLELNPLVYHKPGFNTRWCHSYIVSTEGAKFLDTYFNYIKPVDHMYNEIIGKNNYKSYYTKFGFEQGTLNGAYKSVIPR